MSRIGKQPIIIPKDVTVTTEDSLIKIKGPKGELTRTLHPVVIVETGTDDGQNILKVQVKNPEKGGERALWGLFRALLANMVEGVTKGYEKQLEVNGVGYRVSLQGNKLTLEVGFSHSVEVEVPDGVEAKVEKNIISLSGVDKELVGQIAAKIRAVRKPEPYKGKGIKYVGEQIRRKAGKAATGTGAA